MNVTRFSRLQRSIDGDTEGRRDGTSTRRCESNHRSFCVGRGPLPGTSISCPSIAIFGWHWLLVLPTRVLSAIPGSTSHLRLGPLLLSIVDGYLGLGPHASNAAETGVKRVCFRVSWHDAIYLKDRTAFNPDKKFYDAWLGATNSPRTGLSRRITEESPAYIPAQSMLRTFAASTTTAYPPDYWCKLTPPLKDISPWKSSHTPHAGSPLFMIQVERLSVAEELYHQVTALSTALQNQRVSNSMHTRHVTAPASCVPSKTMTGVTDNMRDRPPLRLPRRAFSSQPKLDTV